MKEVIQVLRYILLGVPFAVVIFGISIFLSQSDANGNASAMMTLAMFLDLKMIPGFSRVIYGLTILVMFGAFFYCVGRGIAEFGNRLLQRIPRKWRSSQK